MTQQIRLSDPPSLEQILMHSTARSELSQEQLTALRRIRWWDQPSPDRQRTFRWEMGAPPPGRAAEFYVIVGLFTGDQADAQSAHRAGDVRIYCAPTVKTYAGTTEEVPYGIYTFNTLTSDLIVEGVILLESFVKEVGRELRELAIVQEIAEPDADEEEEDDDDAEETRCPTCGEEVIPGMKFCPSCAAPLPAVVEALGSPTE
jgi:hypothetical protein